MKIKFILVIFLLSYSFNYAQKGSENNQFATIDAIMDSLYSVISGDKGTERNKELFQSMFHPDAKLIASNTQGLPKAIHITPEDFITTNFDRMKEIDFYEGEIHRIEEQFGNIAHVWSTYEKGINETKIRGVNSLHLFFDEERWWVINLYWQDETEEHPLPKKYLP